MTWSLGTTSVCMLVGLMVSVMLTHVSGQPILVSTGAPTTIGGSVFIGWYSVGTPVSVLVNTTPTIPVTYLPSCYFLHHPSGSAATLELFKSDGATNKVVASGLRNVGADSNTRLLWPSLSLNASDSGRYKCRFQPTTGDSVHSYILHVVVPVNVTEFNLTSEVFTNTEVDAVCCAEGYPEPVFTVTANGSAETNLSKKTVSDGGSTVCQHFELTARSDGKFEITCRAKLGNYNCSAIPAAAYNLCRQTINETSFTKMITANEQYCSPSVPAQILPGSLNCSNNNTFKSMCQCSHGFSATSAATTSCLGNGTWSAPIPNCNDIDECTKGQHNCHSNASCVNTDGSYKCNCKGGFTGNGTFCYVSRTTSPPVLSTIPPTVKATNCKHGDHGKNDSCSCNFGWKGDACDKADLAIIIGLTIAGCVVILIFMTASYVIYRKLQRRPNSVPPGMNRKNFKEWEERDLELERREQEAQQDSKHDDEAAATSTFSGSHSGDEYTRLMRSDQKKQQPTSAAGGETYAQLNRQGGAPAYEDANPVPPGSIEMADLPANEAQYDRLDRGSKPAPQKTTTNVNYEYTQANFPPPPEAAGNEPKLDYAALEQKDSTETFDSGAAAAGKTVYSQVVPKSQRNQSESEN